MRSSQKCAVQCGQAYNNKLMQNTCVLDRRSPHLILCLAAAAAALVEAKIRAGLVYLDSCICAASAAAAGASGLGGPGLGGPGLTFEGGARLLLARLALLAA